MFACFLLEPSDLLLGRAPGVVNRKPFRGHRCPQHASIAGISRPPPPSSHEKDTRRAPSRLSTITLKRRSSWRPWPRRKLPLDLTEHQTRQWLVYLGVRLRNSLLGGGALCEID